MDKRPKLKINHLYSKSLNIYGDIGNILALQFRAERLGIDLEVENTELGEDVKEADIYFIGGGQDNDQVLVFKDLLEKKDFILKEVKKGKVFLLICGGYQLFGKFFVDGNGNTIEGLNILDIETRALDISVSSRCIGNLIVKMSDEFIKHWDIDTNFSEIIVGFENHGGQTLLLSSRVQPIGKVLKGSGNNSHDKLEGCFFENIIGSYCHGSLLPKNPHLSDAIFKKALIGKSIEIKTKENSSYLDSEKKAHDFIKGQIK